MTLQGNGEQEGSTVAWGSSATSTLSSADISFKRFADLVRSEIVNALITGPSSSRTTARANPFFRFYRIPAFSTALLLGMWVFGAFGRGLASVEKGMMVEGEGESSVVVWNAWSNRVSPFSGTIYSHESPRQSISLCRGEMRSYTHGFSGNCKKREKEEATIERRSSHCASIITGYGSDVAEGKSASSTANLPC